ncbi:hypothetical protein ACWC5O_45165 [Streptomyces sp. NPDC001450]|uniref:hypothetical protein n=1 Tax=Streptomyces sp. NPDC005408 TaxID=3155341 RepID=UPI0033A904C5
MSSTDGDANETAEPLEIHVDARTTLYFHGPVRATHAAGPDWVIPVIATASVLPFMQALAAEAGRRSYEAARERVRNLLRREGMSTPRYDLQINVREDTSGLTFAVPANLPDEALAALAVTDLERLVQPEHGIPPNVIYWDAAAGNWQSSR